MSARRTAAAAVVAACAVTVVGCDSAVAGRPVASPATATVSAEPTTSAASTAVQSRWIDVTVPGGPTRPDTNNRAQFGALPIPGVKLVHWEGGDRKMCTVGPVVHSNDGQVGVLTAGHCTLAPGAAEQYLQTDADGSTARLGTAADAVDEGALDAAVIWTGTYDPAAAVSAIGGYQVERVMSEAEIRELPSGTPICVAGAKSGVKCGPLSAAVGGSVLFGDMAAADDLTVGGDSGSAVFVVDGITKRATLIGLVARGGGLTEATFLTRALDHLRASAVTVP